MDRNVLWTLKQYPELSVPDTSAQGEFPRLAKTFKATLVSKRLLMFNVYFLNNVAHPPGMSLQEVKITYDRFYGRPSVEAKRGLQKEITKIKAIQDWPCVRLVCMLG